MTRLEALLVVGILGVAGAGFFGLSTLFEVATRERGAKREMSEKTQMRRLPVDVPKRPPTPGLSLREFESHPALPASAASTAQAPVATEGTLAALDAGQPPTSATRQSNAPAGPAPRDIGNAPAPSSSTASERRSHTVREVPWRRPGLCSDAAQIRPGSARARYLATFIPVEGRRTTLFVAPTLDTKSAESTFVQIELTNVVRSTETALGLETAPPHLYLHANPEELRANACVNDAAVAYYDGAVHLSVIPSDPGHESLLRSLKHEYAHHALLSHDISEPIWFQEGIAMSLSGERMADFRLKNPLLDLERMTRGFPHNEGREFAEMFYGQAHVMVTLLNDLCLDRRHCGPAELIAGLQGRRADPEALFAWGIEVRAGALQVSPIALLTDYVTRGFRLGPAVIAAASRQTPTTR